MSTLKVNTVQHNTSGFNNVVQFTDGGGTQNGVLCRAWVNFDGTFGTSPFTTANGGIRAAFNVSSITDNGTGDYTVNFSNSLPDGNYCLVATQGQNGNSNPNYVMTVKEVVNAPGTGGFTLTTNGATGGTADSDGVYVAVFR